MNMNSPKQIRSAINNTPKIHRPMINIQKQIINNQNHNRSKPNIRVLNNRRVNRVNPLNIRTNRVNPLNNRTNRVNPLNNIINHPQRIVNMSRNSIMNT
eukprot:UN06669